MRNKDGWPLLPGAWESLLKVSLVVLLEEVVLEASSTKGQTWLHPSSPGKRTLSPPEMLMSCGGGGEGQGADGIPGQLFRLSPEKRDRRQQDNLQGADAWAPLAPSGPKRGLGLGWILSLDLSKRLSLSPSYFLDLSWSFPRRALLPEDPVKVLPGSHPAPPFLPESGFCLPPCSVAKSALGTYYLPFYHISLFYSIFNLFSPSSIPKFLHHFFPCYLCIPWKPLCEEFPGSPVVRAHGFPNVGGTGSIPGQGTKMLHAMQCNKIK